MSVAQAATLDDAIAQAVAALDFERSRKEYWEQNECLHLKGFLPPEVVERYFVPQVNSLKPKLNRNYIPGSKKGGSVSYFTVREQAREFMALYRSSAFIDFLKRLTNAPVQFCPETDPHACALYYYTEPGDHIGWHYDTSYYKGARYTILLGLVDRSPSCKLMCQLYKDDPTRPMKEITPSTGPGDMVIFNGDKLWHSVTPLGEGEERTVLTMEYVTDQGMNPLKRVYSNLKDSFGYFGLKAVFGGKS